MGTDREGLGCLFTDDQYTKTGLLVAEVLWEKQLYTRFPLMENPTFTAFKEYEEVPETALLDFA